MSGKVRKIGKLVEGSDREQCSKASQNTCLNEVDKPIRKFWKFKMLKFNAIKLKSDSLTSTRANTLSSSSLYFDLYLIRN